MDTATYNEIISAIKEFQGLSINCMKHLKKMFPKINHDTLWSILSHEYQKLMRHNFIKSDSFIDQCFNLYKGAIEKKEPTGIILRIAENKEISPCLIAKLILAKFIEGSGSAVEDGVCNLFNQANKLMRDTTLITDPELAYEVFLCTIYDDQYSPLVEITRGSLGQQYEILLSRQVHELKLAYRDEEYLRRFGYDKTPDIKLEIPIAVDGFIIHWIESKALFGDNDAHREYIKNQYSSYWNRFGPGLVIYWFGFVENIISTTDKRFIIRDHMPKNITTIHPTE